MIYPASRGYLQGPPFRGWMVCLLCAFAGMIQAEVPTGSPITPAEVEDAGSWVIFDSAGKSEGTDASGKATDSAGPQAAGEADDSGKPDNATKPDGTAMKGVDEDSDPATPSQKLKPASAKKDDPLKKLQEKVEALEKEEKKRAEAEKKKKEADAAKPTTKWSGQLQTDYYWFNQTDASRNAFGDIENGEAFRRARMAMLGEYGPSEYRIEMDFALVGRPSFLDVFAGLHDLPHVGRIRVGHFFEPFSLERMTPNRYVTFMERSLPDQPFAPARNSGICVNKARDDLMGTWSGGVFRSDSDVFGDDVGDNFEYAVTGRTTWLPFYDEACDGRRYFHMGIGASYRGANGELVRFRSQPEARIGAAIPNVPFFVDTGNIAADSYRLLGSELAWVHGPFSLQSEYMLVPVDSQGQGILWFQGWYATASYFLTGEHRPYQRLQGTFDRVIPQTDVVSYYGKPEDKCLTRGWGAWELATRVSQLDLDDGTVRGGRLTNLTLGLNWYLNPYLRVTTNYIHAFADRAPVGNSDTDIVAMRVGYEF